MHVKRKCVKFPLLFPKKNGKVEGIFMANEIFLHARKRGQSIVENSLLDDANLTGMAKYLLIQFCSHRGGDWKINMKDIIKRSKNGRDAHYKALTELIHNKYVARIRVTFNGKHVEQIYVYGQIKEDVAEMLEEVVKAEEEEGYKCRVEYGEPHPENPYVASESSETSEKPHTENPYAVKTDSENQYNTNNQIQNTNIQNININNNKDYIDDDKRTSGSSKHNEEYINTVISLLREATKDDLTDRSFKAVLRKVMDKYNQGKVDSFRDYLATALANKIEELELRRIKEQAKSTLKESKIRRSEEMYEKYIEHLDRVESNTEYVSKIPIYKWWEED
jgi:hypothetical protein